MPDSGGGNDYLEQAKVLVKAGKLTEAIPVFEDALSTLEMQYGEDGPELAECLQDLGQAYEKSARLTDALRIYTRALRLGQQILGNADPAVIDIMVKLIEINESLGRPGDALFFCEQAMDAAKQCLPANSRLTQQIVDRYHHFANLSGRRAQAPPELSSPASAKAPERKAKTARKEAVLDDDGEISDDGGGDDDTGSDGDGNAGKTDTSGRDLAPMPHIDLKALKAGARDVLASYPDEPESAGSARTAPAKIKAAKGRGLTGPGSTKLVGLRLIREFGLPAMGVITVLSLVMFFVLHNPMPSKGASAIRVGKGEGGIDALYRTADEKKKIRLTKNNAALLVTGDSALEVPYAMINADWAGLGAALAAAVSEKQLWAAKKDSQIKTEDNTVYYAADGPEVLTIAKMARLAGNAQACFLRTGEYPGKVSDDLTGQYTFENPLTHVDEAITIRPIIEHVGDNGDVKTGLESGTSYGDEQPYGPCKITCYAVQTGGDAHAARLRVGKFFVRGCDRNGAFLTDGTTKDTFVIAPSAAYLLAPEPPRRGQGASAKSSNSHADKHGKSAPRPVAQPTYDLPLHKELPAKPTRLWIISNCPCPLVFVHFSLPLLLLILTAVSFGWSQMAPTDMKGKTTGSGSNAVLIVSAICLALTVVALAFEIVIFS